MSEATLDDVVEAAREAGRSQERQSIAKALYAMADAALTKEWFKPEDVSMADAREIAQDAIRVAIWEVVIVAERMGEKCDWCGRNGHTAETCPQSIERHPVTGEL